ncbi:single-stranded-DNA-specific exonuclease RecJ [Oribacterium parvum]|uniref:single-stranded-DNA-specific exonuclease RecJ n=1 Tax=Oribacterium parvum TaxID=1501329 RepID=UPI0028F0DCDB|nr:single-stranded-DNA-specific exonuclease RecJ [Oribacterium parvum]
MRKKNWYIYGKKADFQALADKLNLDPVLVRILRNRDLETEEEMREFLSGEEIPSPLFLPDSIRFINRLERAIDAKEKIRIVGDYDVDGVCATTILYLAISQFTEEGQLSYVIPHRINDGYGINKHIIEEAKKDGVQVLITCDNGISAFDELRFAKEAGMDVLLTDHHDLRIDEKGKKIYPEAFSVVNPKREDSKYKNAEICGAMVVYLLMKMLIEKRGRGEDVLDELLCFAGIATVCDVMSLQKENRIVVRKTLELLPKTRNIGLEALLALYWKEGERELSAFTLGFQLGPAINASGRLESAMESISLFLEKDREKAMLKAEHLKELNEERKSLTGNAVEEARKLAEAEGDKKLLLLYLPALHESLAGIVAGRIKEEFYRPTFVVTKSEEGKVKGSGRSIPAYPMAKSLEKAKELLLRFGGHPMAAGFSLEEKNLPLLKEKLEKDCSLEPEDMVEKLWIDTVLPFSYCTEEFTESLRILEPFGKGNEKPSFAEKEVEIQGVRVLGEHRNVVKLNLSDPQGKRMEGIYFTDGEAFLSEKGDRKKMNIVYYPRINSYNGQKQVQAVISAHRFL